LSGTTKRTVNIKNAKMVKDAITEYCVVGDIELENTNNSVKPCTVVRVTPKTGRTHQIRVHLASITHPVLGDALYGGKAVTAKGIKRHMLHAYSLEISIKDGKRMLFTAPFPEDMKFISHLDNTTQN
jgi:23S rRNA-/tRNA-specific pseudouridylate synthase